MSKRNMVYNKNKTKIWRHKPGYQFLLLILQTLPIELEKLGSLICLLLGLLGEGLVGC